MNIQLPTDAELIAACRRSVELGEAIEVTDEWLAEQQAALATPQVGDRVTVRDGVIWCDHPVPATTHVVVAVHDYRLDESAGDVILVVQEASTHDYLAKTGHPVNAEYGVYLGLDDVVA